MIAIPPTRLLVQTLLLVVALLCGACGSVPPSPIPSSSVAPSALTSPSLPDGSSTPAPEATGAIPPVPLAGLAMLVGPRLLVIGTDGVAREVSGPGDAIEAVALSATGIVVVRTNGPAFHVARIEDIDTDLDAVRWHQIDLDQTIALRPLSAAALSPSGERLAVLAGTAGSGEPFQVVIVDIASGASTVLDVAREANGPPVWVDNRTVLLEVTPTNSGGPFLRLDADSGAVAATKAFGSAPAISADGMKIAVLGVEPRSSIAVMPTDRWLAGVDPAAEELVDVPLLAGGVSGTALDSTGDRLAISFADEDGEPASVEVFGPGPAGWASFGSVRADVPRWFGWLR